MTIGCRKQSTTIAVLPPSASSLLWQPLRTGVRDGARQEGFDVAWEAPPDEDDVESQLGLLKDAIDTAQRGVVLVPDETLALRTEVLRAVGAHIPVVVIDNDFGPPAGPFLSYVSSDEKAGTAMAAQRLSQKLHGHGTIDIVGINPQQERSVTRDVLFEESLSKAAPQIQIAQRQFGNASIAHEQEICQELLDGPRPPDAIVALSAASTRGAYDARLADSHHPATLLIGFDQGILGPLRDGVVDSVVIQDTEAIGQRAIANILRQIAGKRVAARTMVAPMLITRTNIDSPAVAALLGVEQTVTPDGDRRTLLPAEPDARAFLAEAKEHAPRPGVQPIGDLIRISAPHLGVTVQGRIISLPPMLGVQDATSSLFVKNFTTADVLRLGDTVEVHGDLISHRFSSQIENASVKVLWADRPIPPFAVTAMQLTSMYRGQNIAVEGNVLSETRVHGAADLVLEDGGQIFRALVDAPSNGRAAQFAPGSRVRVRGIATSVRQLTNGIFPFTVVADRIELLSAPLWWSPLHIAWLVFGAFVSLLVIQWLLHRIQRWHLSSMMHERERLAFEMHDTLAQSFTGIAYQLHAAQVERSGEQAVQTHIAHALEMVRMSRREAGRTIASLRPRHRDAPGILAALRQIAERLSADGDLAVCTSLLSNLAPLPFNVADAFFHIGQEAMSNAIQHGMCRTLCVDLKVTRHIAVLTVQDDGAGFSPSLPSAGMGIAGMKRRSKEIRGKFLLVSATGEGTRVTVTCPITFAGACFDRIRARVPGNPLPDLTA